MYPERKPIIFNYIIYEVAWLHITHSYLLHDTYVSNLSELSGNSKVDD